MNLRSFFLPPYGPRRTGIVFIVAAIAVILISTASPTNFRSDWLDPRWWVRGFAVLVFIGGAVMVVRRPQGRGQ